MEAWLERVVIAEGFCPFAARPRADDEVYLEASGGSVDVVLEQLGRRCAQMRSNPSPATTLLTLTAVAFADFDRFLDLLPLAETVVEEFGGSALTLASFHPRFRFGGLPPDDIAHYIHRAPWPTLHLLRAGTLARVAERHPDIAAIPKRNRARAEALGKAFFTALTRSGRGRSQGE